MFKLIIGNMFTYKAGNVFKITLNDVTIYS